MVLDPAGNAPLSFSDMSPDEGLKWAKQMGDHSTRSFKEKLTYAGYNDVDVHYILCQDDMIIAPEHQRSMIGLIEQSSGHAPKVYELKSGHCPTHSQPQELLKILQDILSSR